jgi:hypothetical protein
MAVFDHGDVGDGLEPSIGAEPSEDLRHRVVATGDGDTSGGEGECALACRLWPG